MKLARDLWDGFRGSPGRLVLSVVALSIGMLALTLLLAVLGGLQRRADALLHELGANVVAILPGPASTERLPAELPDILRANLAGFAVAGTIRETMPAPDGRSARQVIATEPMLAEARRWKLAEGRFIDGWDASRARRHAVVTAAIARRDGLRIGSAVRLQGAVFTVVGILPPGGESSAAEWSHGAETVFLPPAFAGLWSSEPERRRAWDAVYLRAPADLDPAAAVTFAQRVARSVSPASPEWNWVTPESLLSGIRRLQRTVAWAAGGIAGLCLLLGGTTLMSLMLAGVRERVGEIGLRRALGASPAGIAWLFVMEAWLVTTVAALLGGVAAWLLALGPVARLEVPLALDGRTAAIPFLASLGLGCIFSLVPAWRAARLQPADALRAE